MIKLVSARTQKIKSVSLKTWHKYVFAWLLFLMVAVGAVFFVQKKPKMPIFIKPDRLSIHEMTQLHQVVQSLGNQQFYHADLKVIADKVASVSWVDSVQVRRDWQRGVVIDVVPKVAIANFGSEHLLDVTGRVFSPANQQQLQNPNFIRVYGQPEDTKAIMDKMYKLNQWFQPMGLLVEDMIVMPRHTWVVRFNTGLRVSVDYERADEKLYLLSMLLKDGNLPIALKEIQTIDLRYKNGFSITKK